MKQKLLKHNRLTLRVEDIQYLPEHRCPQCEAPAMTTPEGEWVKPFQDWYHTALSGWLAHLGYVYFTCDCPLHADFAPGSMRVARLGDAVIQMRFDRGALARQLGVKPDEVNAHRVSQAVAFLAQYANPKRTSGEDFLAHTLQAVNAGMLSPHVAAERIRRWMGIQFGENGNGHKAEPISIPACAGA